MTYSPVLQKRCSGISDRQNLDCDITKLQKLPLTLFVLFTCVGQMFKTAVSGSFNRMRVDVEHLFRTLVVGFS